MECRIRVIETKTQRNYAMNFSDLDTITTAINAIETWASAVARESEQRDPDYKRIGRLNEYLKEAKQEVFDLCIK